MNSRGVVPILAAVVVLSLSACGGGGGASAPSTVTVTKSTVAEAPTSTVPPVTDVTIPDVTGQNAELAKDQLENLGLTKVEYASANPKYSVVLLARNWTVTAVEPAPGTVVKSDDAVILKVYKD